jgi:hypothetical protein
MKTSPEMIGVGTVTGEGLCCPAQVEPAQFQQNLRKFFASTSAAKTCQRANYPADWRRESKSLLMRRDNV